MDLDKFTTHRYFNYGIEVQDSPDFGQYKNYIQLVCTLISQFISAIRNHLECSLDIQNILTLLKK